MFTAVNFVCTLFVNENFASYWRNALVKAHLARRYLEVLILYFIQTYSSPNAALKILTIYPSFYKETSCKETLNAQNTTDQVFMKQPTCHSSRKQLCDQSLIEKGFVTILDISSEAGKLLSWWSGYYSQNKGEYELNQSNVNSFVERMAKNNSMHNDDG